MALRLPFNFTRRWWRRNATPKVTVKFGDLVLEAKAVECATGSVGWQVHGRHQVRIPDRDGGHPLTVWVQFNVNATVIGSKDLPRDEEKQAEGAA